MADKDHHQAGTSQPEKCMTACSNMIHNLEFHMRTLDSLCRTCGNRALTFKQKMNKSHRIRYVYKYTKLIADYFGVDPSADCVTVHPDKICSSCYNGMMTYKRSPKAVVHQVNRATALELVGVWTGYKHSNSVDSCAPCLKFIGQMKGGRPKAVSAPKRLPFDITMDDIFNHLYSNVPIIDTNSFYLPSRTEAQKQNDTCQVCKSVFPLRTVYFPACEHMFCSKCVSTLFKVKLTSEIPCPTCPTMTPFSQICKPNLQITTGFEIWLMHVLIATNWHHWRGWFFTGAKNLLKTFRKYFRHRYCCRIISLCQRITHSIIIPQRSARFTTLLMRWPRINFQYQSQSQSQSQRKYQCQH